MAILVFQKKIDIIIFKQFQLEARYLSTEFRTDGGVKYIKSIESFRQKKIL